MRMSKREKEEGGHEKEKRRRKIEAGREGKRLREWVDERQTKRGKEQREK